MHETLSKRWEAVSLRTKISGVTVLVLALGLTVAGVGTLSVLSAYLTQKVDNELQIAASEFLDRGETSAFSEDTRSGLIPYYFGAVDSDGVFITDNLPDSQRDLQPDVSQLSLFYLADHFGAFTLTNDAKTAEWRVIALPQRFITEGHQQATLLVGRNLSEDNALLEQYALIFFTFAAAGLLVAVLLTRVLVASSFTPLREVEATAARFAAGDFSQRLGGATPNTEVGRLNRSLNAMLSRIDRAFADRARTIEQMRRFIGDASHELRTPLVSVRGYAELYRMGALSSPEEVAQAMDRIEKEAVRMSELVSNLLELTRIDEAKPLQLTAVDLAPLARDAALDAMAGAPDRTVSVVTIGGDEPADVAPAPPLRASSIATGPIAFAGATFARLRLLRLRAGRPVIVVPAELMQQQVSSSAIVAAEENKLRQVITNLMGNALRFTPAGSPIEIAVEAKRAGRVATISVIDHGEGIPPQIREKIFQRFWRADTSRTRDTGGSGLGLAIVSSIVAAHRGTVRALETPGGGATFEVTLPLLNPGQDPTSLTSSEH